MRELKLKYFIDLVSNISSKAQAEARAYEQAQKVMQGAITGTNTKLTDWNALSGKTTRNVGLLQESITGASNKFTALDRAVTRFGYNSATERQIAYVHRLGTALDQANSRASRLRNSLANMADKAPENAAAVAGGYYGGKRLAAPFIRDFSNLESATSDLRVAMLDSNGKVSKDFEKIAAEAKALGEKLPGGTKDFMLSARALVEQGVPTGVIANGGLRGASYFGSLMGMDQYQAATTVAKVREAHGLKDDELVPAADLMQRGRFGFGIAPTDYLEVAKYAAPTYNTMKLTGIDKMRELLAIQGMAAQVGLEASSFGTNYSQMLVRTAQIDSRLGRKSNEAKEVKALLSEHGIDMQFFDKSGEWAGNRNMVQQLEKLRPLSTLDKLKVSNRIFGVEAGRPALRLADAGVEGYDKALGTIDAQASLDSRIEMKMQTFAAKLEALGGTIENVRAQIAQQFGDKSKPVIDGMAKFVSGPLQSFFEDNPTAGTGALAAGAGASAWIGARAFKSGVGYLSNLLRGGASAAGQVAGGAAGAGAAGGAASAAAAASGASKAGMLARGFGALNPLLLIEAMTGPSAEDIERLYAMDREKVGYRGKGFDDPRRLDRAMSMPGQGDAVTQAAINSRFASGLAVPRMDFVTLTAPGSAPEALKPGQATELKVGEGKLSIAIQVSDDRITVRPSVTQQPSLVRIDAGNTNPGGAN
ncbi:phage tail tape measure protein [Variovorax paradoxus]|uniref:Phage-related minor tail protein n=1 Tax=Variovorax paradoxus TaxID=34073 RepID=A0A0H2M1V5_VARPD|nr:phage tail tape measure protein [Variovorax paradoxus]KLN54732.1 phage-related minor tail protein [Variovorax paradoxus]